VATAQESAAGAAGNRRTVLGTCSGTHFIHDGFSDVLYLLLPLWQSEFGLSLFAEAIDTSITSLGEIIDEPAALRELLLGEGGT
jgi:hypothetical protein